MGIHIGSISMLCMYVILSRRCRGGGGAKLFSFLSEIVRTFFK